MTTKQYLNQMNRLNRVINNKLAEIYQLRTMVLSVNMAINESGIQTSPDKDKLGNALSKIVDLEEEINSLINRYLEERSRIIFQIESIESDMNYQVLFSKYIEQKTFEKIAEDTGYSARQIIRIHGNALLEFERKYGAEYLK